MIRCISEIRLNINIITRINFQLVYQKSYGQDNNPFGSGEEADFTFYSYCFSSGSGITDKLGDEKSGGADEDIVGLPCFGKIKYYGQE